MRHKNIHALVLLAVVAALASSCSTPPTRPLSPSTQEYSEILTSPFMRKDVFHVVAPGETLWRLGKMYGVRVEDIMRINNLRSPQELEMGQHLLIPQAMPMRPVVPLYHTDKWKYIIIHHSATDVGNALSLFRLHLRRGFWHGLGYHFVIANGTYGKEDGQIEVSPRWVRQEDGAHCKASGMNHSGIGICLVGNFSKERVSAKQLDSLVSLVKVLKDYYRIPLGNIMGHGQVPGAATECPGNYFPWKEFYNKLSAQG
jgi:LysM repeat protein